MATPFYGTVDGADEYHTERGNDGWAGDTDAKQAALLVASEWIDGKYRASFPGLKVGQRDQVREWPRQGAQDRDGYAIDPDVVPEEVERATYEAALRQLTAPGSLTVDVTLATAIKEVAVEGAVSVKYAGGSGIYDYQLSIPAADRAIAPVLTGQTAASGLVGSTFRAW